VPVGQRANQIPRSLYFDLHSTDRELTVHELRGKFRRISKTTDDEAALAEFHKLSRREQRKRKKPLPIPRVLGFLSKILRDHNGGEWTSISADSIAASLKISASTVDRCFQALEEDASCPIVFVSGNKAAGGRGREKLAALRSWLEYDELPLGYKGNGQSRRLRPSYRQGTTAFEDEDGRPTRPSRPVPQTHQTRTKRAPNAHQGRQTQTASKDSTNNQKCLSDSIRDKSQQYQSRRPTAARCTNDGKPSKKRLPSVANNFKSGKPPPPRRNDQILPLSWGLARDAKNSICWDPARVPWCLNRLASIIDEHVRRGMLAEDILACLRIGFERARAAVVDSEQAAISRNDHGLDVGCGAKYSIQIFRQFIEKRKPRSKAEIAEQRNRKSAFGTKTTPIRPSKSPQPEQLPEPSPNIAFQSSLTQPKLPDPEKLEAFREWFETTFQPYMNNPRGFSANDLRTSLMTTLKHYELTLDDVRTILQGGSN